MRFTAYQEKKMRLSLEMLLLAKVARWLGAVPHLRLAAAVGLWQLFESAGSRAAVSRQRSAREPRSNEREPGLAATCPRREQQQHKFHKGTEGLLDPPEAPYRPNSPPRSTPELTPGGWLHLSAALSFALPVLLIVVLINSTVATRGDTGREEVAVLLM